MNDAEKINIKLIINGESSSYFVDPNESLLSVLRQHGFVSVKSGCDDGTCGVCTVLIGGQPFYSCKVNAADLDG
ncbi:MAG: 2Fe-2S iron-sulfur cluster binding domain-containing protein, partial [Gammaproteobacteria bacterium]|nr:2Fe-2S iron-sulfur cluster binding domain-containing protein [Gammaproteobacteria bacterium]